MNATPNYYAYIACNVVDGQIVYKDPYLVLAIVCISLTTTKKKRKAQLSNSYLAIAKKLNNGTIVAISANIRMAPHTYKRQQQQQIAAPTTNDHVPIVQRKIDGEMRNIHRMQ